MKKLIALLLLPFLANAAPNDLLVSQRNATDTGTLTRTVAIPPGGANGFFGFNGVTVLPVFYTLGSGLQLTSGVLSATPAAQVNADWLAVSGAAFIQNKPTLFSGAYADLTGKPVLFSGAYADLTGKPTLFSGAYADLTGVPLTFAPSPHTHAAADIVSGTLVLARIPSLPISQTTGLQTALDGKYPIPVGSTAQYLRGDGSLATFPSIPAAQVQSDWNAVAAPAAILNKPTLTNGTVTSVTAGTGLSGGTITTTGTVSMPSIGTPGAYSGVTTDAQGRVTAGTNRSINDAPARSLVTTTASTGFQISATRVAQACYEGTITTTSTIGGPASATVLLETADTNSTTPGDWTTKAQQTYSNNITLAIVLNQVQINNWSFCRYIPAGKFVRLRSGSVTGTASAAINATQQETQL